MDLLYIGFHSTLSLSLHIDMLAYRMDRSSLSEPLPVRRRLMRPVFEYAH